MAAAEQQRTAAQRTAALEHLVNEQLKSDLQQVLERRDALYERIAHCLELRNNMTMLLDEQLHSLKTKVPLRLHSLHPPTSYSQAPSSSLAAGALFEWHMVSLPPRTRQRL